MNLRLLLTAVVFALLAAPALADRPNIVVIMSDDAGWADFGFQDPITQRVTNVPTPHLDALAASGVSFSNAYAASVCSPSRAMLTTGMYGGRFGYEANIASATGQIGTEPIQGLPTSITTVWERMQSIGYSTAAVGKWHLGAHPNNTTTGELGNRPQNQGVENFQGIISGSRSFWMGGATGVDVVRRTLSDGAGGSVSDVSIENQYNSSDYVTDVFGDLTVDYIANHYDSGQPFFMYSSFTAPHTPLQATAADLAAVDALGLNVSSNRRIQIAMQIALDRNVGRIMSALDDPNGDGNTSDSIRDNTLVIFLNDNGGDCCDSQPNFSNNGPLRNGKGSQYEGGLRIPMIIAGAGVDPSVAGSVFDAPVHLIDVVPTVFAAGGGQFGQGDIVDGVNLLPHINGTNPNVPHESLYLRRAAGNQSAVRVGDWKLMYRGASGEFELYNLVTDVGESNNVAASNPEIVAQLQQVMTSYDVQMDKARYDNRAASVNQFDQFRFRENAFAIASWSTTNAWTNNLAGGNATMNESDGYANAVLVFANRSQGDYTSTNDLTRIGGLEFMANRIELTDNGQPLLADGRATIGGRGVLLAKNLDGTLPVLALDATIQSEQTYTYDLALDVNLYDNLTIAGDGNQQFVLSGALRAYRQGIAVTKTGSANLSIQGAVQIGGLLDLQAGLVEFVEGTVDGHLTTQAGATVRVGQVGIAAGSVNNDPPPAIVTTGLELFYDAAADAPGDNIWSNSVGGTATDLNFTSNAVASLVTAAEFPALSAAYRIPASGVAGGLNNYFENGGPRSQRDATFEVVFRVGDTAAGADQVLIEAGGSARGMALVLNDNTLTFSVDGDGDDVSIDTTLAAGWYHAVGVIDLDAAGDSLSLYINNTLVGTASGAINDWAGGNLLGIGGVASSATGIAGAGNNYHGDIALARYYNNVAFSAAEVDQNYQALLYSPGVPGMPAATLSISGDWTQLAGSRLELDILSPEESDRVQATGNAQLGGQLVVAASDGFDPELGDEFAIVEAAAVVGQFDQLELPELAAGQMWQVQYSASSVSLRVIVAGDYNADGVVDAADYSVWRDALGTATSQLTGADGNGDGEVNAADYVVWRSHFGLSLPAAAAVAAAAVPEAASWWLAVTAVSIVVLRNLCAYGSE